MSHFDFDAWIKPLDSRLSDALSAECFTSLEALVNMTFDDIVELKLGKKGLCRALEGAVRSLQEAHGGGPLCKPAAGQQLKDSDDADGHGCQDDVSVDRGHLLKPLDAVLGLDPNRTQPGVGGPLSPRPDLDPSVYLHTRDAWFQASTALYGCAIVFHFQALLTAMLHLCFCRKRSQITNVISGFLIITFIMVGIPVIIYGVEQHKPGSNYGFSTDGKMFYVAFYVAIVNAGITLVASMIYSCHSCRNP